VIHRLAIDCFFATPDVQAAFEGLRGDRGFAKSRVSLHPGGLAAAIAHYADNPTPQVVIVEETGDQRAMLDRLGHLAEVCVAGTRVVVVAGVNDVGTYRALLAQGVSEYLIAPVTTNELADAVAAIFADPTATPRGRLIAFFGARGGVGSSTLAHNTAWAIAEQTAEEVVLLDLDLPFGTVGLAFDADARQTVGELLGDAERIDTQLLDRLLVKRSARLQLLPSPGDLRDWPMIDIDVLDKLFDLVRQIAPFVVVDLPHLWSPWIAHALGAVDDLVVVAQPDLPNLRDVKALFDGVGARRGEKSPTRLVLNKVDAYRKTQLTAKDFEETLKVKPTVSVPFDPIFGTASNNGQMIGEFAKTHRIVDIVTRLAVVVSGRPVTRKRRWANARDRLSGWLKTLRK
jgi:pilus assembly protein CpaE